MLIKTDERYASEVVSTPLAIPGALAEEVPAQSAEHYQALVEYYEASDPLEKLALKRIARHAAALELADHLEHFALTSSDCNLHVGVGPDLPDDARTLASMAAPALVHVTGYLVKHERGLHAAAKLFLTVRDRRQNRVRTDIDSEIRALISASEFRDEAVCLQYLRAWQERREWSCARCGSAKRTFLDARNCWECSCGLQVSLREGTVYAQSHKPLSTWFRLTQALVWDPDLTARELAPALDCPRAQTIQKMIAEIRAALGQPDADTRLAGLPKLTGDHLRKVLSLPAQPR